MKKIYSIPLGTDFIEALKNFIIAGENPLSETAVVFAGKRPSLYLKRKFAEKATQPFYPPSFFSMDEFIDYVAKKKYHTFTDLEYADAIWLLYQSIQSLDVFNNHPFRENGFGEFFYWGQYLLDFINQLDTENIPNSKLHSLERNAEIGYDVPEGVNTLLINISILRDEFHETLKRHKYFTRGYKYLSALDVIGEIDFNEFAHIYFAGLFGLTGTEKELLKDIWEKGKGDIILEGEVEDWQMLTHLVSYFGAQIENIPCERTNHKSIKIYSGFDIHSEILKVYKILKTTDAQKTAIILPTSEPLFPLLTFAIDRIDTKYNISLGYPLARTPVFDLISNILNAQIARRKEGLYPARHYLNVILHPFVKNLMLGADIRTFLLDIEKSLTGGYPESNIANKPFIILEEIEKATRLGIVDNREVLKRIHKIFFENFEDANTLYEYSEKIEEALDFTLNHTPIRSYILSGEIFKKMFELLDKMKHTKFSEERFHTGEEENRQALCDFILQSLKSTTLPFETKPIEPVEILGVLESRNIRFDRVVILDVNEGIIPEPKKIDPLVPLGVYDKLGIPTPEHNEEIYRYYFYRLIESAKDVHLLYIDSEDKPRSRYIEQILWEEEKSKKEIGVIKIDRSIYRINLRPQEILPEIKKTENILRLLSTRLYTPSEIDDYIRCPTVFYYSHILNFEQKREVTEDIDVMDRGKIIHRILCNTFERFKNREITPYMYDEILSNMYDMIERHFTNRLITGEYYLFKKLTTYKLESFLKKNVKEASRPFTIKYLEERIEDKIVLDDEKIKFKGRIDRVDFYPQENEYVIVDYKTGGIKQYSRGFLKKTALNSIEDIHKNINSLQLPIYVHLFQNTFNIPLGNINAKLILLRNNEEELLFKDNTKIEKEHIQEKYVGAIKTVLRDILNSSKPFKPYTDDVCAECTFNNMCHI